ncbi:MAG TPA: Rv3654c family TadE-like protein [Acidimicrobiia bacterium]|nr:Rv3654c family TadE-like protein [Acidimicrobiia bacterium]
MSGDRGAVTLVMTALMAVVAVSAIAVAALTSLYAARAQAQAAADAGALAAAVATYPPAGDGEPTARARSVVEANGAFLLGCSCARDGRLTVRVVEVVAGVRARVPVFGEVTVRGSSRAEFDPIRWLRP